MSNRKWLQSGDSMRRRDFLALGLAVAAATTVPSSVFGAQAPAAASAALFRRKLGALDVSALGLGCMSMAGVYNPPADKQPMVALIRAAYDPRGDLLRHRRGLRAVHQRRDRRRGPGATEGQGEY